MIKQIKFLLIIFFLILPFYAFAKNDNKITIIRDTEIEDFLYEISKPIFKSAKLNPDNIKFHIVQNNNINAFVMNGQNIFINTGYNSGSKPASIK